MTKLDGMFHYVNFNFYGNVNKFKNKYTTGNIPHPRSESEEI